jgi:hypothetical protein
MTATPIEVTATDPSCAVDVIAAVRDITDRVEVEEQMHRVLRTLDATDDGVMIFDAATLRYSFVSRMVHRPIVASRTATLFMRRPGVPDEVGAAVPRSERPATCSHA